MNRLGHAQLILAALSVLATATVVRAQQSTLEIVAPPSRDVTPPGVTPGPAADGPLIREPTPPPPPDPARWRKYFLPKTSDAATLHVEKLTIRISGVVAPAPDAICRRAEGTTWPCGRAALYAFRMFIGGRAVECYFPGVKDAVDITAPCRIGRTDLGHWLVQQGWVRPGDLATDAYRKAAEEARCAKRGLWKWTEQPAASCSEQTRGALADVDQFGTSSSPRIPLDSLSKE